MAPYAQRLSQTQTQRVDPLLRRSTPLTFKDLDYLFESRPEPSYKLISSLDYKLNQYLDTRESSIAYLSFRI